MKKFFWDKIRDTELKKDIVWKKAGLEDYTFNIAEMNILISGFETNAVVKTSEKPKE